MKGTSPSRLSRVATAGIGVPGLYDPATGETLWTFREPETRRWRDSMRGVSVSWRKLKRPPDRNPPWMRPTRQRRDSSRHWMTT
jgi:hypothetical protein